MAFEELKKLVLPNGAFGIHIFAIKEIEYNTGIYNAFLGYYLLNGNFQFIQIPIDSALYKDLVNFKSKD